MSRTPCFFISPEQVAESRITITGDDVRHIATVLRMKAGEELLLRDGHGTEYAVTITHVNRAEITTEIIGQSSKEMPSPRITLGQGLPKSDKMDWIVQKATELGAAAIIPLITERTIVKVKDEEKRISRWQKIAREAAMQSNRHDIPLVEAIHQFRDFLRTVKPEPGTMLLFPWEEGTNPVKHVMRQNRDVKKVVILIGPEGGFSQAEAELARDNGFHLVSLGPNILRTETAAVAALSMMVYELF